jgi:D-tyrosyl-tRNA(Tyr) deacylase
MIALLQRVTGASVQVRQQVTCVIDGGLMVLVGVEKEDDEAHADRLLERILSYRVFPDEVGRMNRSLVDINGGLLLVPQFTLAADTRKGTRPGFSPAADPEKGRLLFDYLCAQAKRRYVGVQFGVFGADMQVTLTNDGPVTFWLQV